MNVIILLKAAHLLPLSSGNSINYVDKQRGGGYPNVKDSVMILCIKLFNEGGGVENTRNHINVVNACPLSTKMTKGHFSYWPSSQPTLVKPRLACFLSK